MTDLSIWADVTLWTDLALVLVFVICSAFFSGSETALTAVSRGRIYRLIMEGNRRAAQVAKLREKKQALIGTILLGNTLVNVSAGALATSIALHSFGDSSVIYVTFGLTLLLLVFGEVLPKTCAIQSPEKFAIFVAPLISVLVRIFSPFTIIVQKFIQHLLHLFGIDITKENTLISATDSIRGTIDLYHSEGEMIKADRDMLGSILDLGDVAVSEVMIHRKNIESLNITQSARQIISKALKSAHTRIPFWKDNPDNIVGLMHIRDLMGLVAEHGPEKVTFEMIQGILSKPWFIPDTTTLREQLHAFRAQRRHFAHVVDEYGVFQGIVTLEDIIEEIVGEIDDEYDRIKTAGIVRVEEDTYLVSGAVTIRDLNRELDWNLPDEDATTIGGLVLFETRTIPEKGATFVFHGCRFTILEKRANQILKLTIKRLREAE